MNRKGSDLLDVFRSAPKRPSGDGGRRGGGGGGGTTLTLGRRHLLLAGAGAVLLVVLAFVAGIGIGRGHRGGGRAGDVALANVGAARTWRLPGAALPRIGPRAEEVLPLVRAALERDWPELIGHYRVEEVPSTPPKAPRLRFTVFGLRTREDAEKWQASLLGWFVSGHVPFEHTRPEPE
jgi:hypothetical protein